MNIHEHQTKNPIEYGGVAVPYSAAVFTPEEAIAAAETLGGPIWVVKSQIHAGGRGTYRFQGVLQTIRQLTANGRIQRGRHRPAGQSNGPCQCHNFRWQRHGGIEDRGDEQCRRHCR